MATFTICLKHKEQWLKPAAMANPVDYSTGTIKMMLLNATFDANAVEFIDEVNVNEVAPGASYSAGGITVAVTVTPSGNVQIVDWGDHTVDQDASGFTDCTHAAVYQDTGTPATSRVAGLIDWEGTFNCQIGAINFNTPNNVFQV